MTVEARPVLLDIPIGIAAAGQRHEIDAMGGIEVPADRYWGAQTQRSLLYFAIGDDRMPRRLYHAYGYVKKAAALLHGASGRLALWKAEAIVRAADAAIGGLLDEHFPLYVWQGAPNALQHGQAFARPDHGRPLSAASLWATAW